MLTRYYELGRHAAFAATDAHEGMQVDLRHPGLIEAAYQVVSEMEQEDTGIWDLPETWQQALVGDQIEFLNGYHDALAEISK